MLDQYGRLKQIVIGIEKVNRRSRHEEEITGYFKETSGTAIYEKIQSKIYLKEEEDSLLERSKLPNTYGFSKALAESMFCENHGNIPLTIVRPSIVGPSLSHPHAGWVDSVSAISASIFFYGGGFIHFYFGKPDVMIDVVPCDYVAYCLLQAAKKPSDGSSIDRVRIINAEIGSTLQFYSFRREVARHSCGHFHALTL